MWYQPLLEKNLLPDPLLRIGIRRLLKQRLREEDAGTPAGQKEKLQQLIRELRQSPLAVNTGAANEQHYEVPTAFFELVLGKYLKYSSGWWDTETKQLSEAEKNMLEISCERARLSDGQKILELGCGWGSLSLYMAEKFPGSSITAVSNSRSQKQYIDEEVRRRRLNNLRVITADINSFEIPEKFDRIVSVEMFEHLRNYKKLFALLAGMLKDDGLMFVHVFVHRQFSYKFEVRDESDWMSKYFFTGGIMPSEDLFFYFNEDLSIKQHWNVNGLHYSLTAEAWLKNLDENKKTVMEIFRNCYGEKEALKWFSYWRIFFMACAELWAYAGGKEWYVSHYQFIKNSAARN